MAPRLVCPQVDDDDPVAAFCAAVRDVGDSLPRGRDAGTQVEAYVVEVAICEGDGGRENDGVDYFVGGKVHGY
ncbi:hypothetical protein GRF29_112g1312501 [Pseudopithomyces chartarum]|uniref:Uncharacterized protein n=1 Tax=Pseudopithomyces chartarum TaxID=1892770 RepID=A0AAN6LVE6_9PLEO|nr:hypothetical protein GRF29_112g1312501 [Pseudopithomyces chartarum]